MINAALDRVYHSRMPDRDDLVRLLSLSEPQELQELFAYADAVRERHVGREVYLRGIIEFSSHCDNPCVYCGLRQGNATLSRYRMTHEEILSAVDHLARKRIATVVLQAGEDASLDPGFLSGVIAAIRARSGMAITVSVGEKPRETYTLWKKAGADRYLLKIETTDAALYERLHPGMSFENRLRCLDDLIALGYQTGSGIMVGLPGQTLGSIADDILFFKDKDLDMIGIGPFIPHPRTPLADAASGEAVLVLKTVALTRIVTRTAHMPATTALGSLDRDHRLDALKAGANVLMPNFTPVRYKRLYEIYPGKRCIDENQGACAGCAASMARSIDRTVEYSRGDAVARKKDEQ